MRFTTQKLNCCQFEWDSRVFSVAAPLDQPINSASIKKTFKSAVSLDEIEFTAGCTAKECISCIEIESVM